MSLQRDIVELCSTSGVCDSDQRSALGIARGSLDPGSRAYERSPHQAVKGRDDLALALITRLAGVKKADGLKALAHARALINEPYQDETLAGFRAARDKRGHLGQMKKVRKVEKK